MSKDSYWFKHDSSAGRGLRMRKMAHIYGHWGKGIYWDVIEILRDQAEYSFNSDTSSLQMLCDLIGCKDESKFLSWYNDCVKLELFLSQDGKFFSEVLCNNMRFWEILKGNGEKGGRPITRGVTKQEPEGEPKRNHNSILYNITLDNIYNIPFDEFWNLYDKKVGKDKAEILWKKMSDEERQKTITHVRLYKISQPDKKFRKDPQTYLRNKCWNDEIIKITNPFEEKNTTRVEKATPPLITSSPK